MNAMNNTPSTQSFVQNLQQLEMAHRSVQKSEDEQERTVLRDGFLLAFVRTVDSLAKLLRKLLLQEGLDVYSPAEAFRQAYQLSWLENDSAWLELIHDRSEIMHAYQATDLETIFQRISKNKIVLQQLGNFLNQKLKQE